MSIKFLSIKASADNSTFDVVYELKSPDSIKRKESFSSFLEKHTETVCRYPAPILKSFVSEKFQLLRATNFHIFLEYFCNLMIGTNDLTKSGIEKRALLLLNDFSDKLDFIHTCSSDLSDPIILVINDASIQGIFLESWFPSHVLSYFDEVKNPDVSDFTFIHNSTYVYSALLAINLLISPPDFKHNDKFYNDIVLGGARTIVFSL